MAVLYSMKWNGWQRSVSNFHVCILYILQIPPQALSKGVASLQHGRLSHALAAVVVSLGAHTGRRGETLLNIKVNNSTAFHLSSSYCYCVKILSQNFPSSNSLLGDCSYEYYSWCNCYSGQSLDQNSPY